MSFFDADVAQKVGIPSCGDVEMDPFTLYSQQYGWSSSHLALVRSLAIRSCGSHHSRANESYKHPRVFFAWIRIYHLRWDWTHFSECAKLASLMSYELMKMHHTHNKTSADNQRYSTTCSNITCGKLYGEPTLSATSILFYCTWQGPEAAFR